MNVNKLRKLCQEVLNTSYQGLTIFEFNPFQTQMYNPTKNEWEPSDYVLFIKVKRENIGDDYPNHGAIDKRNIDSHLESVLGFECCVDFL